MCELGANGEGVIGGTFGGNGAAIRNPEVGTASTISTEGGAGKLWFLLLVSAERTGERGVLQTPKHGWLAGKAW
jgi:hypothetical protein